MTLVLLRLCKPLARRHLATYFSGSLQSGAQTYWTHLPVSRLTREGQQNALVQ